MRRVFPLVLDGEDGGRKLLEMGRIHKREDSEEGEAAGDGVMEDLEDSEVMERVGVEALEEAEIVRAAEVEDVVEVVVEENEVEGVVVEVVVDRVVVDKKADGEVMEIVYVDNVIEVKEVDIDQYDDTEAEVVGSEVEEVGMTYEEDEVATVSV